MPATLIVPNGRHPAEQFFVRIVGVSSRAVGLRVLEHADELLLDVGDLAVVHFGNQGFHLGSVVRRQDNHLAVLFPRVSVEDDDTLEEFLASMVDSVAT